MTVFCIFFPFASYRPKDVSVKGKVQDKEVKTTGCQKRVLEDTTLSAQILSKNKQKKRSRNPNKNFSPDQKRKFNLWRKNSDFVMYYVCCDFLSESSDLLLPFTCDMVNPQSSGSSQCSISLFIR